LALHTEAWLSPTIGYGQRSRRLTGTDLRRLPAMTTCVFVQLRCNPGKTYEVADAIYDREIVSEMYSTSGDFDLMMKIYIPEDADVGKFINDKILDIKGISRSLTTLTFKAF
jgi:DNA-binding Lrp family transcriptional regulator